MYRNLQLVLGGCFYSMRFNLDHQLNYQLNTRHKLPGCISLNGLLAFQPSIKGAF